MKECSKCGVEKPLDEFHKDKRRTDGRRANCKECARTDNANNYARDIERRKASMRAYWRATADERRDAKRRWYDANKETRREAMKRYAATADGREAGRRSSHRRRARIAAAVPQRWRKSETPESLCYWCGCDLAETVTHIEHLMPIALGGPAEAYNEAPACERCNRAKSDTHPLVWLAHQF